MTVSTLKPNIQGKPHSRRENFLFSTLLQCAFFLFLHLSLVCGKISPSSPSSSSNVVDLTFSSPLRGGDEGVLRGKLAFTNRFLGDNMRKSGNFNVRDNAHPDRAISREATKSLVAPAEITVKDDKVNGKSVKDWKVERTLFQALHMATAEELERDPKVCVIGEDVGHYGGSYKVTKDLHYLYGNYRLLDTPICENTFTGMAIGAAMTGLRPVVEGMNMGFLLLAFNQISNNAGMVRYTSGGNFDVPIVIRGPGGIGKQLGPEHSQRLEAYLMAVPGLRLVACSTPTNARGLLKSAIRDNNPVVFFEHVLLYNLKEEIPLLPYTTPLDKAEIARPGKDVTLIAYSRLRHTALEAANQLEKLGVDAEVLDLISLKPLDMESIKASIAKTRKCIILDESSKTGGIGGEIFAQVMENCAQDLDEVPVRLCSKDIPTPYNRKLEELTIVTAEDVVNTYLWMISSRAARGSAV